MILLENYAGAFPLSLARDFAYVPVRMEQLRNGETETVFSLASLTGIPRSESDCSGFR